jgi:hypothetical protein
MTTEMAEALCKALDLIDAETMLNSDLSNEQVVLLHQFQATHSTDYRKNLIAPWHPLGAVG